MKVTLLIPTLNEIDGMKAIMPRIKREWCDQIVIVDGGSTDGTIEYAKEQGYFVYMQKNPGFLSAYTEALPYIEGDIIVTFSPDGNSIPELIPQLIDKMREGYDMVIVSRYLGKAKSEDDDPITAFGNWLFTRSINILHGGHYTDALVIFRAYSKNMICSLDLDKDKGYAIPFIHEKIGDWETLSSVRAAKKKLKVAEIPGDEPPRIGGQRKMKIVKSGITCSLQIILEKFFWR
jgi:glycosyltransferase involved in cell wall biosynthesis